MASAFEKLASLAPWARILSRPHPGSLVARALASSAAERLADTRQLVEIDTAAWLEHHVALSHHFQYATVKAARAPAGDKAAASEANRAFELLQEHARAIHGGTDIVVLAKDAMHTIPYSQLAEARAKVRALEHELQLLQSIIQTQAALGRARDA
jgi:hypothetical protein